MRFKHFLEKNRYQPYETKYLEYNNLSSLITGQFNSEEETDFITTFELDLAKVFSFVDFKYDELQNKLNEIEELVEKKRGSKDLELLQEELYSFAEFIRINIDGFKSILRKHDKKTGFIIRNEYKKLFNKKLEAIEGLNKLIYSISRLKLKTITIETSKENNLSFIRKTGKYWVHPTNLYSLKSKIIQNLPVYVFSSNTDPEASPFSAWDFKTHDTCVSSVYLDNVDFNLYHGRLYKNQGAEAIRIRWYGAEIPSIVFVERKRHEDKWTGLRSKKLRFKIAEKYVVDFLNGKNVWENVKLLNGPDVFDLYKEIQTVIVSKKLRPIVRTFYKRTAFQLPNDSSVRISLDTNLSMIKECYDDELARNEFPLTRWVRPDAVCDWPFDNLKKSEIVRFPYAVLEVKIQGVDESKPKWIEELINSHFLENVHKYSKFMHGCAILFKHIETIPYWLPQMAIDIRKDKYFKNNDSEMTEGSRSTVISRNSNVSESTETVQEEEKLIKMPIRVEPKVFFANERTFLKWVQFSIFLGGIGTAILGFGENESVWCGSMLMLVSILFILYALYTFNWRVKKIRVRFAGPYDDLIGPTVLVGVFLLALVLSIYFKYPEQGTFWGEETHKIK